MGKRFDVLNDNLTRFVLRQPIFFVASAPSGDGGHVNVSPKGLAGSLAVVDPSTVAYLDLTGSGVETIAHMRQNGRITVMFCSFEGPPMILRLFGRGEYLMPGDSGWEEMRARFPENRKAVRAIVVVHIDSVGTSCGFGVPLMDYVGDRDDMDKWADRKGDDGLVKFWKDYNLESVDGLPGLPRLPTEAP